MNSTKGTGVVGKLTTPTITYKPSKVEIGEIVDVRMTVRQKGEIVIEKRLEDAEIGEHGFAWLLSQEDTNKLNSSLLMTVQVDYKTDGGLRYTTIPKSFDVVDSATSEVI